MDDLREIRPKLEEAQKKARTKTLEDFVKDPDDNWCDEQEEADNHVWHLNNLSNLILESHAKGLITPLRNAVLQTAEADTPIRTDNELLQEQIQKVDKQIEKIDTLIKKVDKFITKTKRSYGKSLRQKLRRRQSLGL